MATTDPRVLLFGASGYTGRLTALALASRGLRPVLIGRSRDKLEEVVGQILKSGSIAGGIEIADSSQPASLAAIVAPGDVLVTTVGPFLQVGEAAVEAAITKQARAYIDSTGEPPFIRRIFEDWAPRAVDSGTSLLTAFGYDYVPGNLAAAMVTQDASLSGVAPVRIDVGYFIAGEMAMSGGTAASAAGVLTMPQYQYSAAHISTVRGGASWRTFSINGRDWDGLTVGGTEQFGVPRMASSITEVNVYLGWAGKQTRRVSQLSGVTGAITKVPGATKAISAVTGRSAPAPGTGPSAEQRAKSRTLVVAEAFDGVGKLLAKAVVEGPSPYDLTADLLAWSAEEAVSGNLRGPGALAPTDAFGGPTGADRINALVEGCASLGLIRTS
jgi:short subunit dehydrogenase-like uncharacterized protein